ncbi:MAG: ribonuclease III domain-containing protein [Tepidanaerobacteraceae bacterium]|nr:ribonuclease III domain-containing protein [Tepidanaerobacteraceae bacterium]
MLGGIIISDNHDSNLDVDSLSALALAFVGDSVFDLFIRTKLVGSGKKVKDLHREAVGFVKASEQAAILKTLESELTSRERDIVRNARNAKVNTVPKHADIMDYHYSTAFEALLGYLYLSRQKQRLDEILNKSYNKH